MIFQKIRFVRLNNLLLSSDADMIQKNALEGDLLMPTQLLDVSEHARVRITAEPQREPHKKAGYIFS